MRTAARVKASIAAFAMALGLLTTSALQAAPPAAASTQCPPYVFLGVHGTNEGINVIGADLQGLYIQLGRTGMPKQALTGWEGDDNLISDFVTAFGEELESPPDYSGLETAWNNFEPALNHGVADLYSQITGEEAACQGTPIHFILAGFSQGAAVVHDFANTYPGMAGNQVAGIILFADPWFDGNDPTSYGGQPPIPPSTNPMPLMSSAGWSGVFDNSVLGATFPSPINSAWDGRLASFCALDDPVCDFNASSVAAFLVNSSVHGSENQITAIMNKAESDIEADEIGWAPAVYNANSADFYTTWQNDGGASGFLSQPSADDVTEPGGGYMQVFSGSTCGSNSGSALMWSPSTGTHAMIGCIYNAFMNDYGGPGGTYGYPTTDQEPTPNGLGVVNYMSGSACSSTESGSGLYYSAATGTWPVKGCIFQEYKSIQDTSGIGLPTSGENVVPGGHEQNFSNGSITDANGSITYTINSTGGSTLDNTDPYASGCVTSAYPQSTVLETTDGPTVIDLEWSSLCGTNWTQVTPNTGTGDGAIEMFIWVERENSDGSITQGDEFEFPPDGATIAWSNQLYAPTEPARACEQYWVLATKEYSTPVCTAWSAST
jgi:hypothetical protein